MIQPTSLAAIRKGIQQYGAAPGGKAMMQMENEAAIEALRTGVYIVWRSHKAKGGDFCARVGPRSRCFCGHLFGAHRANTSNTTKPTKSKRSTSYGCSQCSCLCFQYIPQRPEEVGEWWLPRRKGFNVHTWRAKCRCGHPHDAHDPRTMSCKHCSCSHFSSNFCCVTCDGRYEDHETVFESAAERTRAGRPVGAAFKPLAAQPDLRRAVFAEAATEQTPEELFETGAIDAKT